MEVKASEVKNRFGKYLEAAQKEPIVIRKSGKLTAGDYILGGIPAYSRDGRPNVGKFGPGRRKRRLPFARRIPAFSSPKNERNGCIIEKLPPKHFRQLVKKIFSLCEDPYPPDSKGLKGYTYQRVDAGEYRIIY